MPSQAHALPSPSLLEHKLDLLLQTGQLLMQSGADSNRINRTVRRVSVFLGIPAARLHMHFTLTTLMISIGDGDHSLTKLIKITHHGVNMTAVSAISKLSWRALEENLSFVQYEQELERIGKIASHYPRWLVLMMAGLACGGFCRLFGGDVPAMVMTALAAASALWVRQMLHKTSLNTYITAAIAAFVATVISGLLSQTGWSATPHHPLFAAVLFLIPGVPLINSLDDMVDGFTIVGLSRGMVCFFIVTAMAFGMTMALSLLGIQEDFSTQLMPPDNFFITASAAALAAVGFAVLFNVPVRTLVLCALGGSIAVLTRNAFHGFEYSLPLSSFFGAFAAGIWSILWVHMVRTPGHVIAIPAVIPMVPGVLAYQAMMGLITFTAPHNTEPVVSLVQMFDSGIKTVMALMGLAFGVAIPTIIDRSLSARMKEKRVEKAIQ